LKIIGNFSQNERLADVPEPKDRLQRTFQQKTARREFLHQHLWRQPSRRADQRVQLVENQLLNPVVFDATETGGQNSVHDQISVLGDGCVDTSFFRNLSENKK